jgi:hypothetical protein
MIVFPSPARFVRSAACERKEAIMLQVHDRECGLCTHFGEHHASDRELVQARTKHQAPEELKEDCCHPRHAPLDLLVTANSCCDGFEPAMA